MTRIASLITSTMAALVLASTAHAEPAATSPASPAPAAAKPNAALATTTGAAKTTAAPKPVSGAAAPPTKAAPLPKAAVVKSQAATKPAPAPRQKDAAKTVAAPTVAKPEPVPQGVLNAEEMALNCKRMAGRMQVRILELRGGGPSRGSSAIAQGLQSAVVPIIGGTSRGMHADGDRNTDIAKLRAMNAMLKQQQCPHYDLDAELAKPHSGSTPKLVKPGKP